MTWHICSDWVHARGWVYMHMVMQNDDKKENVRRGLHSARVHTHTHTHTHTHAKQNTFGMGANETMCETPPTHSHHHRSRTHVADQVCTRRRLRMETMPIPQAVTEIWRDTHVADERCRRRGV